MGPQKTLNCPRNLERKNKARDITLPDLTIFYKATVIKTAWYWQKTDTQVNAIEQRVQKYDQEDQLIFDKGGKIVQWTKDSLFNKWCLETGQL